VVRKYLKVLTNTRIVDPKRQYTKQRHGMRSVRKSETAEEYCDKSHKHSGSKVFKNLNEYEVTRP